ncbi:alkaline phosphatase [Streptomyces glaucescens]|uniref:alkaline phosphatase n=1 Tax=Streptomyces glaucescens TaxID=1907 RepID=UPI00344E346D
MTAVIPVTGRAARRSARRWGGVAAALVTALTVTSAAPAPRTGVTGTEPARPRNVILLVGDGMGDSEITAARNYTVGAGGRLAMDRLPMTGSSLTYAVDERGRPDYVTDSAAGATAWATGHKTVNGRVAKTPDTDRPLPTLLELARRQGYATGSVTTARLTDATPAALTAHVTDRSCAGPADMAACPADAKERGGAGSIAEQTVALRPDVLLGGGADVFGQRITAGPHRGRTVLERARAEGYQVVRDRTGLRAARPDRPVLGLFADGPLPVEWTGVPARPGGTAPQRCGTGAPAHPAGTPSLEESTRAALELLTARARRAGAAAGGFFLQVEGAAIDDRAHDADPCGQIGETVAFDRAVGAALAYAARHPGTLVVVTADHGSGGQILPLEARPPGRSATLVTDEGAPLHLGYASGAPDDVQEHTGVPVRVAARGPYAERVVGVHENTALFHTVRTALGLRSIH